MIRQAGFYLVLIFSAPVLVFSNDQVFRLPNISQIDEQVFKDIGVDRFISLFSVFTNDNVVVSEEPFTIFTPSGNVNSQEMGVIQTKEQLEQLLLNHIILGSRIDPLNLTDNIYKTAGGQLIHVTFKEGKYLANSAGIIESKVVPPNGVLIVIDSYLFLDKPDKEDATTNRTAETKPASMLPLIRKKEQDPKAPEASKTFMENVLQVLSYLKSGVRVFHHFLSRSNVSSLINEGEEYTVLVPTDHAFHRWHPIDWGFYPFSVPEFTENVMVNHFVKGNHRQENIRDSEVLKTLGGQELLFKKDPLSVNGVLIVKGDTPLKKGNIMFISEVLFVNESIVSRLHQQHRDKETPPLLAFPWFGAQFLSHAFLALERDNRFKQITRFLNLADLAPHVSGTGYTFFVPIDTAFEELGLDKMPDNYLSNSEGLLMLLNHFVKGRLYDKDLKDGFELESLGNKSISIRRKNGKLTVNKGTVIESEVFVYNLGTMYYVDKLLFVSTNLLSGTVTTKLQPTTQSTPSTSTDNIPTVEPALDSSYVTSSENEELTTQLDTDTLQPYEAQMITEK